MKPYGRLPSVESILLAPTKDVALAQMNAMRGFSLPEQDASPDEAVGKEIGRTKFCGQGFGKIGDHSGTWRSVILHSGQ